MIDAAARFGQGDAASPELGAVARITDPVDAAALLARITLGDDIWADARPMIETRLAQVVEPARAKQACEAAEDLAGQNPPRERSFRLLTERLRAALTDDERRSLAGWIAEAAELGNAATKAEANRRTDALLA